MIIADLQPMTLTDNLNKNPIFRSYFVIEKVHSVKTEFMRLIKSTLLILITGLFSGLQAQDIHWSLFQMSPLTLNPALTGAYEGTARIGGIYRDQARSFLPNAYVTPSFYGDAPLLKGAVLYNDQAGAGALTNTGALASISYHKSLDKKRNTLLSFGLQGGFVQRSIEFGDINNGGLVFRNELEQQFSSGGALQRISTNLPSDNPSRGYFDLSAGVLLTAKLNKQTDLNIGFSLYHILTPRYGLIETNDNSNDPQATTRLPRRFQLHGQFNFDMSKKWTLSPAFLFNRISSASELQVQALLGYQINLEKDLILKFGPGYRLGDALEILMGVDLKSLRVMASYDATLSSLSDLNNSVGGFEIAASYIIKIFKEPVVKPVIFCPRF